MKLDSQLRAIALGVLLLGTAHAAPVPVLDVTKPPLESGWSVASSDGFPVSVMANGTYITANSISDQSAAVQLFYRDVPFDFSSGFSIDFGLQVHLVEQPHNLFDAGVVFYGSTEDPAQNFAGGPRQQLLFFDPGLIGWGDESATYAINTTDRFHNYRLVVDASGAAQVFVDGTLALERSDFVKIPRLAFGDMTNDPGLNGSFSISYIDVTAPPVPEPTAAWLMAAGLLGLGFRLKKRGTPQT